MGNGHSLSIGDFLTMQPFEGAFRGQLSVWAPVRPSHFTQICRYLADFQPEMPFGFSGRRTLLVQLGPCCFRLTTCFFCRRWQKWSSDGVSSRRFAFNYSDCTLYARSRRCQNDCHMSSRRYPILTVLLLIFSGMSSRRYPILWRSCYASYK